MSRDWQSRDDTAAVILGVIVVVVVLGVAIWWHWTHKCVETRMETCSSTDCVSHDRDGRCMSWHSRTYPCER